MILLNKGRCCVISVVKVLLFHSTERVGSEVPCSRTYERVTGTVQYQHRDEPTCSLNRGRLIQPNAIMKRYRNLTRRGLEARLVLLHRLQFIQRRELSACFDIKISINLKKIGFFPRLGRSICKKPWLHAYNGLLALACQSLSTESPHFVLGSLLTKGKLGLAE